MNLMKNARCATLAAGIMVAAALLAGCANGLSGPNIRAGVDLDNPDKNQTPWVEDTPPSAPAYDTGHLIDIDMPPGSNIRMGIDPKTITINQASGVVRYVVVARGAAAVNAMYEGIRCSTGEFRIYARQVQGQPWAMADDSRWSSIGNQTGVLVQHPYQLALGGICNGPVITATVGQMVRLLQSSELRPDWYQR